MTPKQKIIEKYIDLLPLSNNVYQICEKAVEISDEFAIGFAEWRLTTFIKNADEYTMKELLKIYKKENNL